MFPGNSIDECHSMLTKILKGKFGKKVVEFNIIDSEPTLKVDRDYARSKKNRRRKRVHVVPEPTKDTGKEDYSKKSKSELKEILKARGIKFLYHDTIDMLREKCIASDA